MNEVKIGTRIKTHCIACDEEEIWRVIGWSDEEYLDGIFKTYKLQVETHFVGGTITTNLKDNEEGWYDFEIID